MNTTTYSKSKTERRLLQSIVEVARHVFKSAAASVFLIDPETSELIFQAVAGEGNENLVGRRFPPHTGIAGFVAASGQTMLVDDLQHSTKFSSDAAKSTGYIPQSIIAAPLFSGDTCIGVLEVLDRGFDGDQELVDVETLTLLADQAAVALELLTRLNLAVSDPSRRALVLLDQARTILATTHA